jgi:hypothetical protein
MGLMLLLERREYKEPPILPCIPRLQKQWNKKLVERIWTPLAKMQWTKTALSVWETFLDTLLRFPGGQPPQGKSCQIMTQHHVLKVHKYEGLGTRTDLKGPTSSIAAGYPSPPRLDSKHPSTPGLNTLSFPENWPSLSQNTQEQYTQTPFPNRVFPDTSVFDTFLSSVPNQYNYSSSQSVPPMQTSNTGHLRSPPTSMYQAPAGSYNFTSTCYTEPSLPSYSLPVSNTDFRPSLEGSWQLSSSIGVGYSVGKQPN